MRWHLASMFALRHLDRHHNRRFGVDADARWMMLAGDPAVMSTAERIDLLLLDADAEWPGAFDWRPATPGAHHEDFGRSMEHASQLRDREADYVWETVTAHPAPDSLADLLRVLLGVWRVAGEVPEVDAGPGDYLALQGPLAVAGAALAFERAGPRLRWREQVAVLDLDGPGRQVAAVVGAVLRSRTRFSREAPEGYRLLAAHGTEAGADDFALPPEPEECGGHGLPTFVADLGADRCLERTAVPCVDLDQTLTHPVFPARCRYHLDDGVWRFDLSVGEPEFTPHHVFKGGKVAEARQHAEAILLTAVEGEGGPRWREVNRRWTIFPDRCHMGLFAPLPPTVRGYAGYTLHDPAAASGPLVSADQPGGCWGCS